MLRRSKRLQEKSQVEYNDSNLEQNAKKQKVQEQAVIKPKKQKKQKQAVIKPKPKQLKDGEYYFIDSMPYQVLNKVSKNKYFCQHAIFHWTKTIEIQHQTIQDIDMDMLEELQYCSDRCDQKCHVETKDGNRYNGEASFENSYVRLYLWDKLLIHKYCTTLTSSGDTEEVDYQDIETISCWSPESWTPEDTPNCSSCVSDNDEDDE
jgi:hypothetical protein